MYIFKSKGRTTTAPSPQNSNESMCPNEVCLPEKLNRNSTSNMEEQDLKIRDPKVAFLLMLDRNCARSSPNLDPNAKIPSPYKIQAAFSWIRLDTRKCQDIVGLRILHRTCKSP